MTDETRKVINEYMEEVIKCRNDVADAKYCCEEKREVAQKFLIMENAKTMGLLAGFMYADALTSAEYREYSKRLLNITYGEEAVSKVFKEDLK